MPAFEAYCQRQYCPFHHNLGLRDVNITKMMRDFFPGQVATYGHEEPGQTNPLRLLQPVRVTSISVTEEAMWKVLDNRWGRSAHDDFPEEVAHRNGDTRVL